MRIVMHPDTWESLKRTDLLRDFLVYWDRGITLYQEGLPKRSRREARRKRKRLGKR